MAVFGGHRTFLGGLVGTKAASSKGGKGSVARATGSSPGASNATGLGAVGAWDIDYAVKNGLEKVIWVAKCADTIARSQAGIHIVQRKGLDRRSSKKVDNHDLWRLLNYRTNPYETAWQTRYRLSIILQLARRGAFLEVVWDGGVPKELHILPPGQTEPVPDPEKFVKNYKVTRSDYQVDELEPEQVIWLRLQPHPTDPYAQMTPLVAAGIDVDTDFLARLLNRQFLAHDGRPGMFITVDGGPGGLNPSDIELLKERFGGGPVMAGQTTVVEAISATVQDLAANPRDIQWGAMLDTAKERILLAFGVPESVMGNASGRTFDNADAERENFWLDTMVPHCDNIGNALDPLTGDTEDDMLLAFDYEMVDVLQRMAARRREEWRTEFAAGLISVDTYRERAGQPLIGTPASKALFLPNGIAIAADPKEQDEVDKLKMVGAPAGPDLSAAARAGAQMGSEAGVRSFNNQVAARALRLVKSSPRAVGARVEHDEEGVRFYDNNGNLVFSDSTKNYPGYEGSIGPGKGQYSEPHVYARDVCSGAGNCVCGASSRDPIHPELVPGVPNPDAAPKELVVIDAIEVEKVHPYLGLRHRLEGGVEGAVLSWDKMQEDVVCERLMHVKCRKGTRHWEGPQGAGTKALSSSYAVDVERWTEQLTTSVGAMVRKAVRQEIRNSARDLDDNGILDLLSDAGLTARDKGSPSTVLFGPDLDTLTTDIVGNALKVVDTAARNQSRRLMDTIDRMDADGYSMKDIETAVRKAVGTRATWRKQLATQVVTTAVEGARALVYERAGRHVTKTWNTVGDERVRDAHRSVDGVERKNGKAFRVGSSLLQYPGDPAGEPEDVINCRCYLTWHVNTNL
jgi:HK97 family phage portal protein